MPHQFGRPATGNRMLASFTDEAGRLRAFVPPFRFTSFFSPEDTLLCAIASEAALAHARLPRTLNNRLLDPLRIVELTTGSGLVGLYLLRLERGSKLVGLDIDPVAIDAAARNARALGLSGRARFACTDIWSDSTAAILARIRPRLMICNPPYVPEPRSGSLEMEAGAGPDGTAHLMRTLELAKNVKPRALALSWCSLSDPGAVVRAAENAGYNLNSLFMVVIADGEYSGTVHDHLRSLPHAYINEDRETIRAVAPDGSGRFAYLLMSGDFSPATEASSSAAPGVQHLSAEFATRGLPALKTPIGNLLVRSWIVDRWDEIQLRAILHGESGRAGTRTA